MPAKIHLERMMYRNSIAVTGESAASYALLKLIPSGEGADRRLRLNLALALDVSGSMYEEDGTGVSRLQRIQDAATAAIAKLQPDDRLALVAFANDAKVVLPTTTLADRAAVEAVLERIDRFDVDPGGTAMDQGIGLGLAEIERNAGDGQLSQVVVLTDGETTGEHNCRDLARQAAEKKVRLSLMGVGTEWNASLLKDLARLSGGKWYYIDVDQTREAQRVFSEEFEHLTQTAFTNVEIHLRPVREVKVKRVRQVAPEIKELPLAERGERHLVATVGVLERDKTSRYIIDLSLPRRPDGNYVLSQVEVQYDLGSGWQESSGPVPLETRYTESGQGYINAEVAKHIDEVQIFEMNASLQKAIATENKAEVHRLAEGIAKKGDLMGPRAARKTMLARQVLQELNAGGRVSKKTQLAVDDAARLGEEAPG
jgi:Ca-activated chloride channel family protein